MNEYKVKYKASLLGIAGLFVNGEEITTCTADLASEAIEKVKKTIEAKIFPYDDEINFQIIDVAKI